MKRYKQLVEDADDNLAIEFYDEHDRHHIIHSSTRRPGVIQVTRFIDIDGVETPAGHEEYKSLIDALDDYSNRNAISDKHEVFKLEHGFSDRAIKEHWWMAALRLIKERGLEKTDLGYAQPYRPVISDNRALKMAVSGVDLNNRIGVVFTRDSIPLKDQERMEVFPLSPKARHNAIKEWVKENHPKYA